MFIAQCNGQRMMLTFRLVHYKPRFHQENAVCFCFHANQILKSPTLLNKVFRYDHVSWMQPCVHVSNDDIDVGCVKVCEVLPFFVSVPFEFWRGHSRGVTLQRPHATHWSL